MLGSATSLSEYAKYVGSQNQISDRQNADRLLALGLIGEIGSITSEVKKKNRDKISVISYKNKVIEEIGDALWYIFAMSERIKLDPYQIFAMVDASADFKNFEEIHPQHALVFDSPATSFENSLLYLAKTAGTVAQHASAQDAQESLKKALQELAAALTIVAREADVNLAEAATANQSKTRDRWPTDRTYSKQFDIDFPTEEQLPIMLTIDIYEREATNKKKYVIQKCNELLIGDRLTDNIMTPDDYRFHDVFHYAYAAVLGWSPVTRALLKLKRKSNAKIDEGEDGARAILIEEGLAAFIFSEAKQLDFFHGFKRGEINFTFLKSVRHFVRGYECEQCPLWLWEEAILQGNAAFRQLRSNRRGRIRLDRNLRVLQYEEHQNAAP